MYRNVVYDQEIRRQTVKRYLYRSLYYPVHFGIIASCLMNSNLFHIDSLDLSFVQALCATYGQVFELTIAYILPIKYQISTDRNILLAENSYQRPCIPGRNCLKTIKVSKLSIPVLFIYLVSYIYSKFFNCALFSSSRKYQHQYL